MAQSSTALTALGAAREEDADMEQTFRFMDLPVELRTKIYSEGKTDGCNGALRHWLILSLKHCESHRRALCILETG